MFYTISQNTRQQPEFQQIRNEVNWKVRFKDFK